MISFGGNVIRFGGSVWLGYSLYAISITQPEHGTISAPVLAHHGNTVTLTNTPSSGYTLDYFTVDGEPIEGNSFVMPDHPVTISAVFTTATFSISITQVTHGTISAPSTGRYGDTITISSTPDSTYEIDYYTVNGTAISGNTFTMPASDVVISGAFKYIPQAVYVNRLNDIRDITATSHYLYPYMTSFQNQSDTPRCSSGWNIGTVTANGSMPSSYNGMPQANYKGGAGNHSCSILQETSSMNEFTWGIWVKTGSMQDSWNWSISAVAGCVGFGYRPFTVDISRKRVYFTLNDGYGGGDVPRWGNATVEMFNGANGSEYGSGVINSGYDRYNFGFELAENRWYYLATYFNRTTHTVEYYVDGTLYFRLTNVPDNVFTDTRLDYNAINMARNISATSTPTNTSIWPSFCEYVIYDGKRTGIPAGPITA